MNKVVSLFACSLVALLVGAGSGFWGGLSQSQGKPKTDAAVAQKVVAAGYDAVLRELKPIVTNLSGPPGAWIRLETAVSIKGLADPALDRKLAEFASDTTDFLRSLSAKEIQGPSGLRRLREDLLERARFRLGKEAESVLIQTLVIQ